MLCITATTELALQLFILASRVKRHSSELLHWYDTTAQQTINIYLSYTLGLNEQLLFVVSSANCLFKSSSATELLETTLVYFSLDL